MPHASLPPPAVTKSYIRLEVPHLRQWKNLCVPTSAAMVLKYFGETADPVQLKAMAGGDKPATRRNADFTYWDGMSHALAQMGYRWAIKTYPRTRQSFETGIRQIRRHLKKGWPVLIDVHQDVGHTFVATGYDDVQQAL